MVDTKHDRGAKKLAKKVGADYNSGKGADIIKPQMVIEYETDPREFGIGIRQLQGYKKSRYLGVPNSVVQEAIERTKNTKVGVITPNGKIRKRADNIKGKKRR